MQKQRLINILFISSFSFFGVGRYLAHTFNFSVGYVFSLVPLLAILLFYLLDVLYQKKSLPHLHANYVWLLLLALAYAVSFIVALRHNQQGMNNINIFVFVGVVASCWYIVENLQKLNLQRTVLGAIINVILNFWLIPIMGIVGAAIATLAAQVVASFLGNAISVRTRSLFFMQAKALTLFWK